MIKIQAELTSIQIAKEANCFKMTFVSQEQPSSFLDTLKEHLEQTETLTFGNNEIS